MGQVPPGASPDAFNVIPTGADAMALRNRKGLECKVHEDRVPANLFSNESSYSVGDRVWAYGSVWKNTAAHANIAAWQDATPYVANDVVWSTENDSTDVGLSFTCLTNHTSGATMLADSANWRVNWAPFPSVGILASPSFGTGVLFQVQRTRDANDNHDTILAGSFAPAFVSTQPEGFLPPEVTPEETVNPVSEYAYLMGFPASGSNFVKLFQVDLNALSTTASGARLTASQATGAGNTHLGAGVKMTDGRFYWLAWRQVINQDTTISTILTHFGAWDGTTLDDNVWNPKLNSGGRKNNFDRDDVPTFVGTSASGQLVFLGDNDGGETEEPEPYPPQGDPYARDIMWRLQISALPDSLFAGDGARATIRPDDSQNDTGWPVLIGLPSGDFLFAATNRSATIKTRRINWSGSVPAIIDGSRFNFTTSFTMPSGRTSLSHQNYVTLVDGDTIAVARGTTGFSVRSLSSSSQIDVPLKADGVLGHRSKNRIYTFNDTDNHLVTHDRLGNVLTTFTSSQYAVLGKAFRGMCLDANERNLILLTYDSGASAGARLKITLFPVGWPEWVTSTFYAKDTVVQTGTPPALYIAAATHTSGTFATDLTGPPAKWTLITTQYTLDMASHTAVEDTTFIYPDSMGSVNRNITAGATT